MDDPRTTTELLARDLVVASAFPDLHDSFTVPAASAVAASILAGGEARGSSDNAPPAPPQPFMARCPYALERGFRLPVRAYVRAESQFPYCRDNTKGEESPQFANILL